MADPVIPNLLLGPQKLGVDRTYLFGPLVNEAGVRLTSLVTISGSEPITFTIWAGDIGDALVTISGSWDNTGTGVIAVTVLASAIASLDPGRYRISGSVVLNSKAVSFIPDTLAFIDISDSAAAFTPTAGLTRAKVERTLVRRCGRLLSFANLDGKTDTGTNADLSDPIATALRDIGIDPFDPVEPSTSDIASVASDDHARFLDIAELRCLESILNNIDEVSEKQGTDQQEWNQWLANLQKRVDAKRKALQELYGYGLGELRAATLLRISYTEPEPGSSEDDDEAEL